MKQHKLTKKMPHKWYQNKLAGTDWLRGSEDVEDGDTSIVEISPPVEDSDDSDILDE